ncbi:erythronate-4-phosphate dehydrogenase [Legionella busanensis]|uniref:Erythronate-4-phosphate dehydrogenase n=1 Tax=Legionella busanensis TaxID=190655 RepID=A0A378JRE9_9GAMM|nr:4-phosphoerythronate dehydrogenase [Legionella busanensis]STX50702.1 erythronate-4-phosphate dehydrogenase [Legionella busanensis]
MNILADASLPGLMTAFPPPFNITLYHQQDDLRSLLAKQDILLCRSTLKVTKELLKDSSLSFVATASSGTDHIDEIFLKQKNITLLDAKGSNAGAVADYVIATIAYLQKYTSFKGKKAGIIGLGAVGSKVAKRLKALNFEIIAYDPPKALVDNKFYSVSLNEILECDLICIHANLHNNLPFPSRHLISESILTGLKPNIAIINASRGGIVDEAALLSQVLKIYYCTDVFAHEPNIDPNIIKLSYLCTPHIAGHSIEAKFNAVIQLSQALHQALNLPYSPYSSSFPSSEVPDFKSAATWQDYILALYNPIHETNILKQAINKNECFLRLRKAHQKRHDFILYESQLPKFIKPLLS